MRIFMPESRHEGINWTISLVNFLLRLKGQSIVKSAIFQQFFLQLKICLPHCDMILSKIASKVIIWQYLI